MKKLFITALFAILMGGFALTANAQPGVSKPKPQDATEISKEGDKGEAKPVEKPKFENQTEKQGNKYKTLIKDYKAAVNTFVTNFDAFKEGKSTDKINLKKDLNTAKDLRGQIESKEVQNDLTAQQKENVKSITMKLEEAIANYEAFFMK